METVLYGNNCPRCFSLKAQLKAKNIKFKESNNLDLIIEKGFRSMPILQINNEFMDYNTAVDWVKKGK